MADIAEVRLRDLCQRLGLRYEAQDWGIVNADPARVLEFIDFYRGHPELHGTQKFELGELILASANEALDQSMAGEPMLAEVCTFVRAHVKELEVNLGYWRSLAGKPDFPIGRYLQECLEDAGP